MQRSHRNATRTSEITDSASGMMPRPLSCGPAPCPKGPKEHLRQRFPAAGNLLQPPRRHADQLRMGHRAIDGVDLHFCRLDVRHIGEVALQLWRRHIGKAPIDRQRLHTDPLKRGQRLHFPVKLMPLAKRLICRKASSLPASSLRMGRSIKRRLSRAPGKSRPVELESKANLTPGRYCSRMRGTSRTSSGNCGGSVGSPSPEKAR